MSPIRRKLLYGILEIVIFDSADKLEDLVDKSSGVFLWVKLACRSLILGFADYDRIHELQRRVEELPPELEEMFQHMLIRINKRHREQGSRLLRICFVAQQVQSKYDSKYYVLPGRDYINDDYTSMEQIPTLSSDQKRTLCEELEGRLRSRTGGLLEANRGEGFAHEGDLEYSFCNSSDAYNHDGKIDAKVVFMHRTVFEFLCNEKSWDLECLRPPEGLEPASELSVISLYSAMISIPIDSDQTSQFLSDGLCWGAQSDIQYPESKSNIFWVMQPFIDSLKLNSQENNYIEWGCDSMVDRILRGGESSSVVVDLAVEAGAISYFKNHISFPQNDSSKSNDDRWATLLYHAVALPLINNRQKPFHYGGYNPGPSPPLKRRPSRSRSGRQAARSS
ncbi:hypothetical protein F4811DRAFT_570657 [Daldinia bambusicola]|nr:hypothetical protein F4811DRAFT_570657 [Daldinia bambusicola]